MAIHDGGSKPVFSIVLPLVDAFFSTVRSVIILLRIAARAVQPSRWLLAPSRWQMCHCCLGFHIKIVLWDHSDHKSVWRLWGWWALAAGKSFGSTTSYVCNTIEGRWIPFGDGHWSARGHRLASVAGRDSVCSQTRFCGNMIGGHYELIGMSGAPYHVACSTGHVLSKPRHCFALYSRSKFSVNQIMYLMEY